MGVKSTVTLTRDQAIERLKSFREKAFTTDLDTYFGRLPDPVLEQMLELMNDHAAGGEGFENYSIDSEAT